VKKEAVFQFSLKDLNGNEFHFPNEQFKNKVTIIQIMGTWCPNCMDETRYYKQLYDKYHAQGLEIISVGYEVGNSFEDYANKIKLLKDRFNLDFTFLVGGNANKGLASSQFSMLNEVISFPTSIYIGKDGVVKRVHTGFNGPGTGEYYTEYVEKTNLLIESLLKEK
jgi:thiol-disulfide isomerase/thioredoxin